jgi:hypothetical protein
MDTITQWERVMKTSLKSCEAPLDIGSHLNARPQPLLEAGAKRTL